MGNLLVPTDFSPHADYALDLACQLAPYSSSDIVLLHTVESGEEVSDILQSTIDDKLEERKSMVTKKGLACRHTTVRGNLVKAIEDYHKANPVDLITMGSHGTNGPQDVFLGSNTIKVLRKVHLKILVVKEPIHEISFNNVLFASSLTLRDKKAFKEFLAFIAPFDSQQLHIVTINTASVFSQPAFAIKSAMKKFQEMAQNIKCQTQFYSDYTVSGGIKHYCEENDIDLIAISNHGRSTIKRIFQGSHVESLINRSSLPVLSVDF